MKKIFASLIGLWIFIGSIHMMPQSSMADEMASMSHCGLCTEEPRTDTLCEPDTNVTETHDLITAPSVSDCDCHLHQSSGHHPDVAFMTSSVQNYGELHVLRPLSSSDISPAPTLPSSHRINAPPSEYLGALNTVQQLK